MKQKLEDLRLLVQGSRKAKFAVFMGILMILFLIFGPKGAPPRKRPIPTAQEKGTEPTTLSATKEQSGDLLVRFQTDVEQIQKSIQQTQQETIQLKEDLKENEERTAQILKKVIERMADQDSTSSGGANSPTGAPVTAEDPYATTAPDDDEEEQLEGFGNEEPEVLPPPPPPQKKVAFVGAGDSVRVKLLAGVNAPTDGTPYPVVFELSGDVNGPDGSTLPLGGARLIAAAQGSLTDQRALFRLTSLNIQLPSGERKVYDVDGWIVGEDGVRGMSGVLIDPIGKAIAGAAMTGAIEGAGQGLAQSNQQVFQNGQGGVSVITNGSLTEFAAGRAAARASQEWSGIIRQRLNAMVPVVQVLSGREATAVFSKNLAVEGLIEALDDEENVYASLD
jgi:hypothetical protein